MLAGRGTSWFRLVPQMATFAMVTRSQALVYRPKRARDDDVDEENEWVDPDERRFEEHTAKRRIIASFLRGY